MPGRNTRGKGDSCLFPFHRVIRAAFTGGAFNVLLSPNATLTPRGAVEADTWSEFRVRSLMFRMHPNSAVGDQDAAAGFIGVVPDTIPATLDQITELLPACFLGGDTTTPTEWVRPSRADLAGPFPWYKAIPGTVDVTEEAPGVICVAGNSTNAFTLEIRGVFEFKIAVATSNTPMAVTLRQKAHQERVALAVSKQRDFLLKVLGTPNPAIKQ